MKNLLLFGLVVSLLICIAPVAGLTAVTDNFVSVWGDCYNQGYPYIGNVLANDIIDTPLVSVEITKYPLHSVTPDGRGVLLDLSGGLYYNPLVYTGYDSLYYRLFDGQSYSNEAKVSIRVERSYNVPVRQWFYTPKNTKISLTLCGPLGVGTPEYETFLGQDRWGRLFDSSISHGTIDFLGLYPEGGTFEYTPDADFTGWEVFDYQCQRDWSENLCYTGVSEARIYVGDPPYPTPEFPSALLPVIVIIGFLGAVLLIQRTKEN